jgi:hypothetical protein
MFLKRRSAMVAGGDPGYLVETAADFPSEGLRGRRVNP